MSRLKGFLELNSFKLLLFKSLSLFIGTHTIKTKPYLVHNIKSLLRLRFQVEIVFPLDNQILSERNFTPANTHSISAHYSIRNQNVTVSKFHKVNSYLGCSQFLRVPQKRFNAKSNS